MTNEDKIPVKVIEIWFRERVLTMVKNFQEYGVPGKFETLADEEAFTRGAWPTARMFLETEFERYLDAIKEVHQNE